MLEYKLEGVMYTPGPDANEDELKPARPAQRRDLA